VDKVTALPIVFALFVHSAYFIIFCDSELSKISLAVNVELLTYREKYFPLVIYEKKYFKQVLMQQNRERGICTLTKHNFKDFD